MLAEFLKLMMEKVTPQRFTLNEGESPDKVFFSSPVVQAPGPRAPKLAATREVARLAAIVEYLDENRDELDLDKLLVHVVSPSRVDILGPLDAFHRTRESALAAVYPVDGAAALQGWTDLDTGRIHIMSMFYQTDARDHLLTALRKVTREKVETREDVTGLSQTVTVSDGTATRGLATIENPVILAPFCTFPGSESSSVPSSSASTARGVSASSRPTAARGSSKPSPRSRHGWRPRWVRPRSTCP